VALISKITGEVKTFKVSQVKRFWNFFVFDFLGVLVSFLEILGLLQ
jgi:hypothetical protein